MEITLVRLLLRQHVFAAAGSGSGAAADGSNASSFACSMRLELLVAAEAQQQMAAAFVQQLVLQLTFGADGGSARAASSLGCSTRVEAQLLGCSRSFWVAGAAPGVQ